MLTELHSVTAAKAASAAYRRQSAAESASGVTTTTRGFGVIEDTVTLSPQAQALLKNGLPGAPSNTDAKANDETAKPAPPSDPFRAYRSADGDISLEAMMQLQMLPRHLRKAGELMRETTSLRDEVNKTAEDPAADPEKLAQLEQEYASAMGALWEELEKLGLAKKMGAADMSMDDLLNAGLNGLVALDEAEEPGKIADDAERTARVKANRSDDAEQSKAATESPLTWAINRGFD